MKKIIYFLIVVLILGNLSACKNKNTSSETKTINCYLEKEPSSLDPQISNDYSSNLVILNIFEGLTRLDSNGNPIEGVAKSWETNQNYTTYTFKLREDSIWSDDNKTPVTSEDFVFGMKRTITQDLASGNAPFLFCIKNAQAINMKKLNEDALGVKAIDKHTLLIELESSNEDFPKLLATSPFMPCNKNFFDQNSGQYGCEDTKILGNGPFKLNGKNSWVHDEKIEMTKNTNYKGPNEAKCAEIVCTIKNESNQKTNMLEAVNKNKIDVTSISSEEQKKASEYKINLISFKDTVWGLTFNLDGNYFKKLNMREAFIRATDGYYVRSLLSDNYSKTDRIVTEDAEIDGKNYKKLTPEIAPLSEDVTKAKNCFDSGAKELNLKPNTPITVLCLDEPEVKSMVSRMLENWNRSLNMYFNMKPVSKKNLEKEIALKNYEMAIFYLKPSSSDALDFFNIFKSESKQNFCNLKDNKYDSILNSLASANSFEARVKILSNAEKYLNDQAIFYPLYCEKRYFAVSKNINDLVFHSYGGGIDFTHATKI